MTGLAFLEDRKKPVSTGSLQPRLCRSLGLTQGWGGMAWRCGEEDSPHPTLLVSLTVDELVRVKALGQENRLLGLYLMRHRHNIYVLIHTRTHTYL